MTMTIEGNFWCCASKQRPQEILFHSQTTGWPALLPAGSLFYGSFSPLFFGSRLAAADEARAWNAEFDAPELRVAPRRIRIVINIDEGKRKEAKNGKDNASDND